MYIDQHFISKFEPSLDEEEIPRQINLNQDLLEALSPNVRSLLDNQGLLEAKYNFYFTDRP